MEQGYNVRLGAECMNEETDEIKYLSLIVRFPSKDAFQEESDNFYDSISDQFNEVLSNKYPNFFIDDGIECESIIDSTSEPDLIV